MSMHLRLFAERDLPGLWPHRGPKEAQAALAALAAAGFQREDAALASPSVRVRITVAHWNGANELHTWFEDAVGPVNDGDDLYVDRDHLAKLQEEATARLEHDEDPDGLWAGTAVKIGQVLANPRLTDCEFYLCPSF